MTLDTGEVYHVKKYTIEDDDTYDGHLCEKFGRVQIFVYIHEKKKGT